MRGLFCHIASQIGRGRTKRRHGGEAETEVMDMVNSYLYRRKRFHQVFI